MTTSQAMMCHKVMQCIRCFALVTATEFVDNEEVLYFPTVDRTGTALPGAMRMPCIVNNGSRKVRLGI